MVSFTKVLQNVFLGKPLLSKISEKADNFYNVKTLPPNLVTRLVSIRPSASVVQHIRNCDSNTQHFPPSSAFAATTKLSISIMRCPSII